MQVYELQKKALSEKYFDGENGKGGSGRGQKR